MKITIKSNLEILLYNREWADHNIPYKFDNNICIPIKKPNYPLNKAKYCSVVGVKL